MQSKDLKLFFVSAGLNLDREKIGASITGREAGARRASRQNARKERLDDEEKARCVSAGVQSLCVRIVLESVTTASEQRVNGN